MTCNIETVLDWRSEEKVINEVADYSSHIFDNDFRIHLSNNIDYCYSDNLDYLPDESYFLEFMDSFRKYYTSIKAFHGCRPLSLKPYYAHGILGQDKKKIESMFYEIFSEFDTAELKDCIENYNSGSLDEEGKIFFVCNDKELIEDSGHYLIQGSEHLQGLATSLSRKTGLWCDYKLRLRAVGIPTILEVDIPTGIIPEIQIIDFCRLILSKWCNNILGAENHYSDMCLTLTNKLSPEYIKKHYHPKRIIDPHNSHVPYISKHTHCDMCG